MSLIGKKVLFAVPKGMENGMPSKENEEITGTVVDKVQATYPNPMDPAFPVLLYDVYIIEKENGELLPMNPNYAIKLIKD